MYKIECTYCQKHTLREVRPLTGVCPQCNNALLVSEWVEEFGGGAWVLCPQQKPVLEGAASTLRRTLYGPAYQGPEGTRATTGTWTVH